MNAKPANQRALLLACAHCTFPGLDTTDSLLLTYLAANADRGTGTNSHPGNRNIADVLKLTDSPTDTRIRKNIERGLIERTERADGRGKASAYRICWENVHFPNQTPGGELLVEEPPCVGQGGYENEPPCEPEKPPCHEQGGIPENRPAEKLKPPCEAEKPPCHEQAATSIPPKSTNPHTGDGLEGWITNHCDQMGAPAESIRNILDGKVRAKGEANVVRALNKFFERPQGVVGLKSPWAMCLKEIDVYLGAVDGENMAAIQKANREAEIAASVERQTKEHWDVLRKQRAERLAAMGLKEEPTGPDHTDPANGIF